MEFRRIFMCGYVWIRTTISMRAQTRLGASDFFFLSAQQCVSATIACSPFDPLRWCSATCLATSCAPMFVGSSWLSGKQRSFMHRWIFRVGGPTFRCLRYFWSLGLGPPLLLDSTRAGWTKACVTLLLLLLHALKFQKMVGELKKTTQVGS